MSDATCTFSITSWNEEPYEELDDGLKSSVAAVTQAYTGAIEGTSEVRYVMSYAADGTAVFVGFERVTGTVDGREGTFVLIHHGAYEGGKARSSWTVVPGRGTGDLATLGGEGSYEAGHGEPAQVTCRFSRDEDSNQGR